MGFEAILTISLFLLGVKHQPDLSVKMVSWKKDVCLHVK